MHNKCIVAVPTLFAVITLRRFEIALWTACRRLSAWKVKPERQTASRGGLKRVAPGEDTIGNSGAGEDKAKPEGTEAAPVSDSGLAEGDAGPEISNQDPAVEEEKELRDALTGMRPAEVGSAACFFSFIARCMWLAVEYAKTRIRCTPCDKCCLQKIFAASALNTTTGNRVPDC